MTAIEVIVALIVGVVGAAAGYFVGYNNRKKTAEAQIGSAEAEATRNATVIHRLCHYGADVVTL